MESKFGLKKICGDKKPPKETQDIKGDDKNIEIAIEWKIANVHNTELWIYGDWGGWVRGFILNWVKYKEILWSPSFLLSSMELWMDTLQWCPETANNSLIIWYNRFKCTWILLLYLWAFVKCIFISLATNEDTGLHMGKNAIPKTNQIFSYSAQTVLQSWNKVAPIKLFYSEPSLLWYKCLFL